MFEAILISILFCVRTNPGVHLGIWASFLKSHNLKNFAQILVNLGIILGKNLFRKDKNLGILGIWAPFQVFEIMPIYHLLVVKIVVYLPGVSLFKNRRLNVTAMFDTSTNMVELVTEGS